jgi:hypothetical protein
MESTMELSESAKELNNAEPSLITEAMANPISFPPPPVKDSDSLKALRARFNLDFAGYVDNLLAPERRANNLSLAVDVGFKFSKLPWTLNE